MAKKTTGKPEKPRIVLVAPDPETRNLLVTFLEAAEFDPVLYKTSGDAKARMAQDEPDAVIADFEYGRLGESFVKEAKKVRANLPMVILTGHTSNEILVNLIRYENLAIIHKPCDAAKVVSALKSVLSNKPGYAGIENREFRRIDTELEATLGEFGEATITNLSAGGAFIVSRKDIEFGSTVKLSIPSMKGITLEGKVVWKRQAGNQENLPQGFGLKFVNVETKDIKRIQNFIFEKVAGNAVFSDFSQ